MWLTGLVAPRHVGSSQTRARTRVPCIGRQTLNHCATREALLAAFKISFSLLFYSFNIMFLRIDFNLFYCELSYGFKMKFISYMSNISRSFLDERFLGYVVCSISRNQGPRYPFSGQFFFSFCNICYTKMRD